MTSTGSYTLLPKAMSTARSGIRSPSRVRTSWARSRCSRRHGNTGTVIGQASCSTTSPPTRCTGRWADPSRGDAAGGESGGGPFGEEFFTEETKYAPHSPYSASKASSDHFVRAYHDTYGMPTLVTNCSNNYGPYQFPEKLIPLFINNIRHQKPLPVYGRGQNVRDWLYVEDHARAIDVIFHRARSPTRTTSGASTNGRTST